MSEPSLLYMNVNGLDHQRRDSIKEIFDRNSRVLLVFASELKLLSSRSDFDTTIDGLSFKSHLRDNFSGYVTCFVITRKEKHSFIC